MAQTLPRRLSYTYTPYPFFNLVCPITTLHRNLLPSIEEDVRIIFVKVHFVTSLDQTAHCQERLGHVGDLKAHNWINGVAQLGDDVSSLLTKIHNNSTVGSLILRTNLRNMQRRQVASHFRRNSCL